MSVPTSPKKSAKFAKKNEVADRRRRVAAMALARMGLAEICEAVERQTGISVGRSTVSRDLIAARGEWRKAERVAIATAQEQELAALASDEARLRGFLVKLAAGDHKARIGYQQAILDVMKLRSKILGTEAPTKVETKVEGGHASVTIVYQDNWQPRVALEEAQRALDSVPAPANGNGATNGAAHG